MRRNRRFVTLFAGMIPVLTGIMLLQIQVTPAFAQDNKAPTKVNQPHKKETQDSHKPHEAKDDHGHGQAASHDAHDHPKIDYHPIAILPFALILLMIAGAPIMEEYHSKFGPLDKPAHWFAHKWESGNLFKFLAGTIVTIPLIIYMLSFGNDGILQLWHSLEEYLMFMPYVGGLYVLSNGMFINADLRATPRNNTIFMIVGSLFSSLMATAGALVFFGRAIMLTNKERKNKTHTIVFSIFTIGNIAGSLTPLGDPPLFLGFLRGVPFFWTLAMVPMYVYANGLLILMYWGLDRVAYAREEEADIEFDDTNVTPLTFKAIEGLPLHLILFSLTIAVIICSRYVPFLQFPVKELIILSFAAISYKISSRKPDENTQSIHEKVQFGWGPVGEVAALFLYIFIAMAPASSAVAKVMPKDMSNSVTFYVTGGASAGLDNAPTYVTVAEATIQSKTTQREETLAKTGKDIYEGKEMVPFKVKDAIAKIDHKTLLAIALGAVFFGAMSYIGNAPNFLMRGMAQDGGIQMPSFFGYIFKWSIPYVLPVLIGVQCLFLGDTTTETIIGVLISIGYFGVAMYMGVMHPDLHQHKAISQRLEVQKG